MVRDVVRQSRTAESSIQRVFEDGYVLQRGTSTQVYYSPESQRDDLKVSDKSHPTHYFASRHSITPSEKKVKIRDGVWWRGDLRRSMAATEFRVGSFIPPRYNAGTVDSSTSDPRYFPSSLVGSARTKCLGKIAIGNYGEAFITMRESGNMILSMGVTLLRLLQAARRRDVDAMWRLVQMHMAQHHNKTIKRRVLAGTSTAAGLWFQFSFGWKPLLNDIYSFWGDFKAAAEQDEFLKVKAASVVERRARQFNEHEYLIGDGKFTKGCEVGVSYRVDQPTLAALSRLGLLNPALIAWQTLPLSFVVDWFLPVSDYLQGLGAGIGLQFLHGYETKFAYGVYKYGTTEYGDDPYEFSVDTFGMVRSPISSWPKPSLGFSLGLDRSQMTTLAGLIAQRL